jgi:hypothetical protein
MILVLSVRFRRYIALFLYCVFYSQLIMAAGQLRASGDGILNHLPRNHATPTSPLPHIPSRPVPTSLPDSVIVPSHNAKMPDFSSSPSFRYPATPQKKPASIGGPTQPEMESFKSVNTNNMVDLFTGDFSYNIPLLDVGGYPVNIAYHSGRSMDEDASWVGLGWNINPGSVTREIRGLPDDFSGGYDTIRKVANIKANTTVGVTGGANVEIVGTPIGLGANIGVFNNTYNGWGA